MAHLGGEALVSQHQGRVGQADRHLRKVLHLHQHVRSPAKVRGVGADGLLGRGPFGRPGQGTQFDDSVGRAPQEQDVVGHEHGFAAHIGDPLPLAAHGHHPHAHLGRHLVVGQVPVGEQRAVGHEHTVRHLLSRAQLGHELGRYADPVGDDAGDVHRVVGDALDGGDHLQHRRHAVGVAGVANREYAHRPHVLHEMAHALLERAHLVGHIGITEVQRRVGEVHHQLGGVLGLRQHLPQIARSVFHQVSPGIIVCIAVPLMPRPPRRRRGSG